jgi:hydrogenase maturation protein HypF
LETQAHQSDHPEPYDFSNLDHRPLLKTIIDDRLAGRAIADVAFSFHAALAQQVVQQIVDLCDKYNASKAALSGGVFQNDLLCEMIREQITRDCSVQLFTNCDVPVNDGGGCLGQAAAAWAHYRAHRCT